MAEPDNIEPFYDVAALLFATLYAAFPSPLDFTRSPFTGVAIVSDSVLWLCDMGYFAAQAVHEDGGVSGVTLAAKGLLVLNTALPSDAVLAATESREPLGHQLRQALQSAQQHRARALAEMAICQGSQWPPASVSQQMTWFDSPHPNGSSV